MKFRTFRITAILFLLFLLVLSKGGDMFVRFLIKPELEAIEKRYDLTIGYKTILLKGWNTVQIKELSVTPDHSEPLLSAAVFNIKINLKHLLARKIDLQSVEGNKITVRLVKHGGTSNYDSIGYAARGKRILNILKSIKLPEGEFRQVAMTYESDSTSLHLDASRLTLQGNTFTMAISDKQYGVDGEWVCAATLPTDNQPLSLRLYTKDAEKKMSLPFTEEKWHASVRFDTLAFEIDGEQQQPGILTVKGKAGVKGLCLYHHRLSPDTVTLDRGFINYTLAIGANSFEIDSSRTSVRFNRLKLNPYIKVEKTTDWRIRAALDKAAFPAGELFQSIPKGLFSNLEGLKAEGSMTYHFLLDVDMANVERLVFESSLRSKDFRILEYGTTDLRKLNTSFSHTIFERGQPVRTIRLGYENPNFRSYPSISRYLPYAIMHAEDAGFMHHNGFLPEAFQRSLVQNIQERRFARGGSTLSMQLVKNVFLSRNKTISRKLEEIMIVWLIESNRLVSKQRMFEIYMNIIEWGPNVYGVTEAAHYYFDKEPSQLTLGECVFLAYIISAPKHVRGHFNGTQIRPSFYPFYTDAVKRMMQRNWITPAEASAGSPNIIIRGPFQEKLR